MQLALQLWVPVAFGMHAFPVMGHGVSHVCTHVCVCMCVCVCVCVCVSYSLSLSLSLSLSTLSLSLYSFSLSQSINDTYRVTMSSLEDFETRLNHVRMCVFVCVCVCVCVCWCRRGAYHVCERVNE